MKVFLIVVGVIVLLISAIMSLSATITIIHDKGWTTRIKVLWIEKDIVLSEVLSFMYFLKGMDERQVTEFRRFIEREAMLQRTQTLREQLDYMQTDEYVMRTARSDLGLILPDEIRYVTN